VAEAVKVIVFGTTNQVAVFWFNGAVTVTVTKVCGANPVTLLGDKVTVAPLTFNCASIALQSAST
jgi:hypothetical protein